MSSGETKTADARIETLGPGWIQTYTGRAFWPLKPRAKDVCIEDIAHALAMKCRFAGMCKRFYSVAQHSVLVSRIVPPRKSSSLNEDHWPNLYAKWGLLHDAAEAYLPDICNPIKKRFGYADEDYHHPTQGLTLFPFKDAEFNLLGAITRACGLFWCGAIPEPIKCADRVALATEVRDLMHQPPPGDWALDVDPLPERITSLLPEAAEQLFLARWEELQDARPTQ